MKNAYDWYNVFILFDFVHEVWKMLMLVKNPTCYLLHKVPLRWRACVSKITCRRLFTIMILDPETTYFHAIRVKMCLVPGDTYLQDRLVYMVLCCFLSSRYNCLPKCCVFFNWFYSISNPDILVDFDLSIF